jgi:hypothetical protein
LAQAARLDAKGNRPNATRNVGATTNSVRRPATTNIIAAISSVTARFTAMTQSAPAIPGGPEMTDSVQASNSASWWREPALMLICVAMLSSIAVYNGYPLTWADTGSYLIDFNFALRSFFYNIFLAPEHLTHTLWTVVPIQAALTFVVLRLVLREAYGLTARLEFLAIIAMLCVLTGLPWLVDMVMPDIFTSMLVLAIFLLVFCYGRLRRWERYFVIALTLVSTLVHPSHTPLALGLAIPALTIRSKWHDRAPMTIRQLALAPILVVVAVIANVSLNYYMIGIATLSPGGYAYELSRLIEHGPAVAYLREKCPTRKYALCEYLPRMPMTSIDFLWAPGNIFRKVGFIGERKEGMEIVAGTIEEYPLWVFGDAVKDGFRQLALVETGVGLDSAAVDSDTGFRIQSFFPDDFKAFCNSRQGRGEFKHLPGLQSIHLGIAALSVCYCFFVAGLFARDREWLPIQLMLTVALALLLNAFITGAIAQPHPRYGARLAWLIPLMALGGWRKVSSVFKPT